MGGFNIGEIFAAMKLDDSQFMEAVNRVDAAQKLLKVDVANLGGNYLELVTQLGKAGIGFDGLAAKMKQVIGLQEQISKINAGLKNAGIAPLPVNVNAQQAVVKEFVSDLGEVQSRIQNITNAQKMGAAIEKDALLRQKEIQDRMYGDAIAQERMLQEAETARMKQKYAMYQQFRRDQYLASAATGIGVGMAAAGAAIGGPLVFGVNEAAHFQDAMTKSLALIGQVGTDLQNKIADTARQAAKDTGIAAKDIAEDFGIMAKGGIDASESIQLVPQVTKFAVATNSELHESTRQVITIMEALRLKTSEVPKVLDELTFANQIARGSVDQLATALEGRSGAALRAAHVSLEQAIALAVAFSKAGITASQSQTFLAQVIGKLLSAARQYGNELVNVNGKWVKFNSLVYDSQGNIRSFTDILKSLDSAFKGQSAQSIGKFFDDLHLGTSRGVQALQVLLSQADVLDAVAKKAGEMGGQMQKVFDQQMQSPIMQLELLKRNLEDIAITIGLPAIAVLQGLGNALKPIAGNVQDAVGWFGKLNPTLQEISVFGVGAASAALLVGGSMLLMAGSALRLYGDLKLLNEAEALGSLPETLGVVASRAGLVGIAIAGVVATIIAFRNELTKNHSLQNGPGGMQVPGSTFYGFGYMPNQSAQNKAQQSDQKPAAKAGEDAGKIWMDSFRKQLEEMKNTVEQAMKSADFSINPDQVAKQQAQQESILTQFQRFSDKYNQIVSNLSGEEQDAISAGLQSLNQMVAKGADPKVIRAYLANLDAELSRFKGNAEMRAKADEHDLAVTEAAQAIDSFNTAVTSNLKTLTADQQSLLTSIIATLTNELRTGTDPKQINAALRDVRNFYTTLVDGATRSKQVQDALNQATKDYDNTIKKITKENPTIAPIEDRIPKQLAEIYKQNYAITGQQMQVEATAKAMGITSQEALDDAANKAVLYYDELVQIGAQGFTLKAAMVKMWEDIAAAQHTSADKIDKRYRQFAEDVQNSVQSANNAWKRSLQSLNYDFNRIATDVGRGLFDLMFPPVTNTQNPLDPIIQSFRDAYMQLAMYSNPKDALDKVIKSIQTAGTTAQANAIAVRYFGSTAGPQLASDLRDGALSATQISQAIDVATKSTVDYQNATQNTGTSISQIWRQAARDIEVAITKYIITNGLLQILKWTGVVSKNTKDMGDAMVQIFKKIGDAIGGLIGISHQAATAVSDIGAGATTGAGVFIPGQGPAQVPNAPIGGGEIPSGGGAGGGIGSAAGGWMGAVSMGAQVVSAVTGVLSFINGMHQETSLNAIEHNTRYLQIEAEKFFQVDEWYRFLEIEKKFDMLFNRLGDIWNTLMGKNIGGGSADYTQFLSAIAYNTSMILSKYDNFIVPDLQALVAGGVSGGGNIIINGNVTVQANSPTDFVKNLKAKRVTRGLR